MQLNELFLNDLQAYLTPKRKKQIDVVVANRTKKITPVIYDVYHEHNSGAIMRNAEAMGIQQVHVIEQNYRNRLVKSISKGTNKWLDVLTFTNAEDCLTSLKTKGYNLVATVPSNKATLVNKIPLNKPIAILLGAEKHGLPDVALNQADFLVHIPMFGFADSFNVSVASALLFDMLLNRLKTETKDWQLTPNEQLLYKIKFTYNSLGRNAQSLFDFYSNKYQINAPFLP